MHADKEVHIMFSQRTIACLVLSAFPTAAQLMASTEPPIRPQVMESYGKLPLSFEANQGQTDQRVKFMARGPGYGLFLTQDSVIVSLNQQKANAVLRMKLLGANIHATVVGTDGLPGKSNYFVGSDPSRWRTNAPTYAAVKYEQVYPGIDLVYHGNQRLLEYDFVLAPGADPRAIDLRFQGAGKLSVNHDGALVIAIGDSEVIEPAPVVYQDIGGQRQIVAGRFVLRGKDRVGFIVAEYDSSRQLVIDPTLVYSTFLGGSGYDVGVGLAVDAAGNAYVTGSTTSSNFPTTAGALHNIYRGGDDDAFVTKLNAAASAVVYSTYLGGSALDSGAGIAVDSSGSAYVTGDTRSSNFPTTPGAFQTTFGGGYANAFVSKLNAAGSALVYSTYLGGTWSDSGHAIAVDATGNAYVTGQGASPDFPITPGALHNDQAYWFVTKLNPTGSALAYSAHLGPINSSANAIAIDVSGNAYVTGFAPFNLPTTAGAFQTTNGGGYDAFVTKVNVNGSALVYSTYLGGSQSDAGYGIAVDATGNAYVTGDTMSSDFPTTPGAFQTNFDGGLFNHAFVTKLNAAGSALIYSTYLGGSVDELSNSIAVDASGNTYITGLTWSQNFPTTPDALQTTPPGPGNHAFISRLNATGSVLLYSTYLGGNGGNDVGGRIAIDAYGNAYVTGSTNSPNFPTTLGAFQTIYDGGYTDAFVIKLSFGDTTPLVIVPQISGTLGNNGWYRSNVTVSWSVTDPESGIASSSGCATTTLTVDTSGVTLTCSATNGAGMPNSASVTIKIDKTPPVISGMPTPGCSLWPLNDKLVPVAEVKARDALSSLAPGSFKVTGVSNESSDTSEPDIVITADGSGGFLVQLRADRLGTGNGRVYTINATAMDNAGNSGTATSTCTVPHDQGH